MTRILEDFINQKQIKFGVPFYFLNVDGKFYIDYNDKTHECELFVCLGQANIKDKLIAGLYAIMRWQDPIYDDMVCPVCNGIIELDMTKDFRFFGKCTKCGMKTRELLNKDDVKKDILILQTIITK